MAMSPELWNVERERLNAFKNAPLDEVVREIMDRYHRETREGMSELETLASEAALYEGWRVPELVAVRDEVDLFCTEMRMHLRLEEATLFPAILAKTGGREVEEDHELKEPLELFEDEHDAAEGLLKRIHRLTGGFKVPEGAPHLQRRLYEACEALAESLRSHIYLEGQILFKRLA